MAGLRLAGVGGLLGITTADQASAHAAEQGLILLLPTDIYIATGTLVFVLTILLVAAMPTQVTDRLSRALTLPRCPPGSVWSTGCSLVSASALLLCCLLGLLGPRDPLTNLLPLAFWSSFWIGFVSLHALVGGLWTWVNPWTGPYHLLVGDRTTPPLPLPARLGHWPAILGFMLFVLFSIADPVPMEPTRLALVLLAYWSLTLAGMILCGRDAWLTQCEVFTLVFAMLSLISPLRIGQQMRLGWPGWAVSDVGTKVTGTLALFCLIFLASGSFDGLNETFWWLDQIGVNPLDFPGRSAIFWETCIGFLAANLLLVGIFALVIRAGQRLAPGPQFSAAYCRFALSVIPIGLGFHIAHFLTTYLVTNQYTWLALTDPLAIGANYLGLGDLRIRLGFLRDQESVRIIWLSQAAVIVVSHIFALLIASTTARRLYPTARQARLAELPLSLFMIAYTVFGLWLLAAPRGA